PASGGKAGSSGSWWKSLTSSRKKPKEQGLGAGAPAAPPTEPAQSSPDSRESQQPSAGSELKPGSRRNLKISRSGRFKEKRKMRATLLAESPKLFEGSAPASEERQ
uniref:Proline rich 15 n=1 Tax=Sphenodon punctatus TaxID=8508 RepID=A0A8D0G9Q5_SPHPU